LSSRWFSRTFYGLVVILAGILVLYASAPRSLDEDRSTSIYTYAIVTAYPHDPEAFTQGLVYGDGFLYELTGLWGRSSVLRVDIQSGEVQEVFDLSSEFFGEGITIQ
jgi:glutamine cyclotransferase